MATSQIDGILDIYKHLAKNPSLTSAVVTSKVEDKITVQSVWSQRNLERCKKQKFIREFYFHSNLQPLADSYPVDVSTEIISAISKNGSLKAVLREALIDGKSKQFIEIWDKLHVLKSYDLSAYNVHGDVYFDPTFSAFQWSSDETRLLYIAEKKLPKSGPFYVQKSKSSKPNDEEELSQGTEYIYKPDWGEQLVGKHRSVIIILDIKNDTITPVDSLPDDYFPSQVIWAPNDKDIIGVAYKLYARYLGSIFCTNRESYIFHLKETEFRKLTAKGLSCRSPRFSPDGKYLIWLERKISPPHHHVHRLAYLLWNVEETPGILIDFVQDFEVISKDKMFYGIYNQNLPKRCWSDDSKYIFFSTPQRSNIKSYVVNLERKIISEIENEDGSSLVILDVWKNYVALSRYSLITPSQLVIGKFSSAALDNGVLAQILHRPNPVDFPNGETLIYDTTEFIYNNNEPIKDFNFTYFGKSDGPEKSMPLIAIPHGGPHVTFSNDFSINYAVFAYLGFGILLINYRGSTGMGGNNLEYILGKVGESDVLDCVTAINTALSKYPWLNPKKVTLYGGSHGGFLVAHLSGQYPEMFQAVVMRNPSIDIAALFSISDIPDWCPGETGVSYLGELLEKTDESNYSNLIQIMLSHSPILHADKVKAPTLIALGSKDLRVPSSQGKLWYYRLKENNVMTKLHVYEDNHSLTKDEVEIDFTINSALWLIQHTSN